MGEWGDHVTLQAAADRVSYLYTIDYLMALPYSTRSLVFSCIFVLFTMCFLVIDMIYCNNRAY